MCPQVYKIQMLLCCCYICFKERFMRGWPQELSSESRQKLHLLWHPQHALFVCDLWFPVSWFKKLFIPHYTHSSKTLLNSSPLWNQGPKWKRQYICHWAVQTKIDQPMEASQLMPDLLGGGLRTLFLPCQVARPLSQTQTLVDELMQNSLMV